MCVCAFVWETVCTVGAWGSVSVCEGKCVRSNMMNIFTLGHSELNMSKCVCVLVKCLYMLTAEGSHFSTG